MPSTRAYSDTPREKDVLTLLHSGDPGGPDPPPQAHAVGIFDGWQIVGAHGSFPSGRALRLPDPSTAR